MKAEGSSPAKPRKPFWDRYGFAIMATLGIVAAGVISFVVQSGILEHRTSGAAGGPRHVKVVYIDTGAVLSHILKEEINGTLSRSQAAHIGKIVGGTIQTVANGYAARGYLVLSSNVLAVPSSNNLTGIVEKEVDARLRG